MFVGIGFEFSTNDERALQIDVADVCDLQLTVLSLAVDNSVFEHETRPVIRNFELGRFENRGLRHIVDATGVN